MGFQTDIRPYGLKGTRPWSASSNEKSKYWLGPERVPKRIQPDGQWF